MTGQASADAPLAPTLRAIVALRLVLVAAFTVEASVLWLAPARTAAALRWLPEAPPLRAMIAMLLVWGSAAVATRLWVASHDRITRGHVLGQLALDLGALTVALGLASGPANPLAALYVLPVLAASPLGRRAQAFTGAAAIVGFGLLMVAYDVAHGDAARSGLLHGSYAALVVLGSSAAWLVQQLVTAAARNRAEHDQLRDATIQDQHLAALGTLAAGAAHELGTPLGTVNLLAAELPHMAPEEQKSAIDTIKREVERCKDILHRMASPEVRVSALSARDAQPWFLCELQDELDDPEGVKLTFVATAATRELRGTTTLARATLGQILRELVTNAAEACRRRPGSRGVAVRIDVDGEHGVIEVEDDGAGMDPAVAAMVFDPFYSTKPEGQGLGLGLYLAKAQMRQLGGELDLQSHPGRGTKVTLRVTLRPPDPTKLLGPMTGLGR
ncbi:MAG: HAMP domain-containing sensor histidine kinase [Nannocystaceae bacterium]